MPQCPRCKGVYASEISHCPMDGTPLIAAEDMTVMANSGARPVITLTAAPVALPEELSPGTPVGEYVVQAKIGEGGMGTVYSGSHPLIGKKVAIKVLSTSLSRDPSVTQRFVQEARAVNQIGHHNIVDIFAFGKLSDGRQYFVMEFLPGRSLKGRLDEQPPLSFEEAFTILVEICDALDAAHAENIIHRDLKPDNVFLVEGKKRKVVKLLDFGIAKLLQDTEIRQTRTGVAMGTPLYMAPEQCLAKPVDARTDIYALGVIMFEMFTGQLPFSGPSYIETVNGHLMKQPPRPGEFAELPEALEALILQCLEKNATERPQTIGEIRERLLDIAQALGAKVSVTRTGMHSAVAAPTPIRRTPSVRVTQPERPAALEREVVPRKRSTYVFAIAGVGVVSLGLAVLLWPKRAPAPAALEHEMPPKVAPAQPAPPAKGSIVVRVNVPNARIEVDDQLIAAETDHGKVDLAPGEHAVSVTAPARQPFQERISVRPGSEADVLVRLERAAEEKPEKRVKAEKPIKPSSRKSASKKPRDIDAIANPFGP